MDKCLVVDKKWMDNKRLNIFLLEHTALHKDHSDCSDCSTFPMMEEKVDLGVEKEEEETRLN